MVNLASDHGLMDARENALLCYGIEGDKRLVEMATPINDLAGL